MNAIISAHKSISFIVNAITKRRIKRKENEEFVKFSRFATLWIRSSAQKKKYKRHLPKFLYTHTSDIFSFEPQFNFRCDITFCKYQ